jgi:hypothetical protein
MLGRMRGAIDFEKYKVEHPWEYPASVSEPEKKEAARRVERAQHWPGIALGLMSALAVSVAVSAAANEILPFLHTWFSHIRFW